MKKMQLRPLSNARLPRGCKPSGNQQYERSRFHQLRRKLSKIFHHEISEIDWHVISRLVR